tara:strand:+ start:166 stop:594 length:429 start_codon:yes stop_codon:yes gene_type:complete
MRLKSLSLIFILPLILLSCGKQKRIEKRLNGYWEIEEMRVIDGQGFTHYITDAVGFLSLDFDNETSNGSVSFQTQNINNGQLFFCDFSGDSLELAIDDNILFMGNNENRTSYSLILHTPKDLVLEYYDFSHYQLRKYIFRKN